MGGMFSGVEADVENIKMHPIIMGYFQLLPKVGANWAVSDRTKWITGLTDAFNLLFKDEKPA